MFAMYALYIPLYTKPIDQHIHGAEKWMQTCRQRYWVGHPPLNLGLDSCGVSVILMLVQSGMGDSNSFNSRKLE